MKPALLLSFLSGYVALSYEILWYRAYSFVSQGAADGFGLMLGAYLAGLALGSLAVRSLCGETGAQARERRLKTLFRIVLGANLMGFVLVPVLAAAVTRGVGWRSTLPMVAGVAAGLGALFPLVSHFWVPPDDRAGARISYLYLANILGSAAGSLLTGFVMMEVWSMKAISVFLGLLGIGMAALLPAAAGVRGIPLAKTTGTAALAALALWAAGGSLFDGLYERLQLKEQYSSGYRFAQVVETKSGVITVTPEGRIFGGGIYDGAFNTSLDDDLNAIVRAYAFQGLHPAPREVLMIGLSSGSWATVLAGHPSVERLTVIEINPGYVTLLSRYPAVSGLTANPKVKIEFDDGRRWMMRNSDRRFDAIVANATFHWRSNSTNLLSAEFLALVRSRLKEGGIYYYNTTGSPRAQKTGATVFPHAIQVMTFLAVSDAPLRFDLEKWKGQLGSYVVGGRRVFDLEQPAERLRLDGVVARLGLEIRGREAILAETGDAELITDDNMGTEWERGHHP